MQSQHTYQAGWANHSQTFYPEMNARASEQQFVNGKARELVAKSLDTYHTASALAQSVETMKAGMQINESNVLDRHKADFDALMAWAIEEKPAFVKMLTALGDELPPKMEAALHKLHVDELLSQPYNPEKEAQKIQEERKRKIAEARVQDYERLEEKLSTANSTIASLKKDLEKAKADSARQAEELVQEKETSRKHVEKIVELLDALADIEEMSEESCRQSRAVIDLLTTTTTATSPSATSVSSNRRAV